jgi:hypothetical protein
VVVKEAGVAHLEQSVIVPAPYELVSTVMLDAGPQLVTPDRDQFSIEVGTTRLARDVVTRTEAPVRDSADPVRFTTVPFEITDRARPRGFPRLEAELQAIPRPDGSTDVTVEGWYDPPPGGLGNALDAMVLHRLARPAIRRHFRNVLSRLQDAVHRRLQMLGEAQ